MGVNKRRKPLSDRVMGSNNGAARVIGFVDFREKIEGGGARIGYDGERCQGRKDPVGDRRFEGK